MASIVNRKWVDDSGKAQIRYDAYVGRKGFKRQSKTFKTKGAADRWIRLIEADLEKGVYKSTTVAERMTLREAMTRYCKEIVPTLKSATQDLSKANIIEPYLGSYPLITLDGEILANYRDKRLAMNARNVRHYKDGRTETVWLNRKVAKGTVRHELVFISRVIEHGRREWGVHLPGGNPIRLVKLPPIGKPRDRRMESDEETRLLEFLDHARDKTGQRSIYMLSLFIFALETASRRSEIVRLRWEDVDLKKRTALLRDTKNGEDRRIGLSTRAVEALMQVPRTKDGRVFPVTNNAVRMAWRRATRRAGVDGLRFHDLRHEATSRLATTFNGDVLAMAAMTGHKSLQMLKRYTHLRAEDLARRLG